jgi:hypothetical protein
VTVHLSVKEAAKRVKRSVRTVERWIADEDLEVTVIKTPSGVVVRRYVKLDHLLAVYRAKIVANPTRRRMPNDDTPP